MSRSRIALRWLPALAWMGIIFWLSSTPQSPGGIELPDKPTHLIIYAILGALLWWAISPAGATTAIALTLTVGALYGASDELHQRWVPGRTMDAADWLADAAGIAAAVLIGLALSHRRAHRDQR